MRAAGGGLRAELIGLSGVLERNAYLVKRYVWWELAFFVWTVANTLTIVFIAEGFEAAGGQLDVNRQTTVLLIGAVIWAYLGIIFEILTETVAWERWEGTIEYTFMAPLSRSVHLVGMGIFAVAYGVVRAALLFGSIAFFFDLDMPQANFAAAAMVLAIASVSFVGIGMMTAVLPLISPEKGTQLGFIAQGMLLVVSGIYYSVDVLPRPMQWVATISPATYALDGIRDAILEGAGSGDLWSQVWPLIVIGVSRYRSGSPSSGAASAMRRSTASSSAPGEPARGPTVPPRPPGAAAPLPSRLFS
jgi:ABC-2 type transport system permease protein